MEEQEKLQKELIDIGAEIGRVSAQAESAKHAEDNVLYRLLLEKEVLLRKEKLLLVEKLEARACKAEPKQGRAASAAGLGVESTTGSASAAGLGVGSATAVAGLLRADADTVGAFDQLGLSTKMDMIMEVVKETAAGTTAAVMKLAQVFAQGMGLADTVVVTASNCPSDKRKQIEHMVTSLFFYHDSCTAPCCLKDPFESVSVSGKVDWSRFGNKERKATELGRSWLEMNLAPPGVVVLVASDAQWLDCTVEFPGGRVKIESSATDYIFVQKEAWEECWASHEEAAAGSSPGIKCSLSKEAVLRLAGSIVGFYEAKTDAGLRNLSSVRGQALLQYLAINYMRNWPARDVIVIFGNFNDNYTIHAGRQDSGAGKWSLHVAGPPSALRSVPEHGLGAGAASSSYSSSPCSVNAGFIRALMSTPRTVATSVRAAGEGAGDGGAGGGGEATGPGGGGGRSGDTGGNGDSTPAVSSSGGGGEGSGGGPADVSSRQAGGSKGDRRRIKAGDDDDCKGAAGGSGGGSSRASSGAGGPDSSGSSSGEDEGGFDGDEGLLEAASDNYFAQAFMSVLRQPAVYQGVLQQDAPPTSFQPPTQEELLEGFANLLVRARLQQADQQRL